MQNVNSVQYKTSKDHPTVQMKLEGNQGGNCNKANGDYQDRVHSDQMVLVIVKRGGWTG
jgi:hypothetical protein